MKMTKVKITNLFGIKEYEAGGQSVELIGENEVGKTSVIDAIRYALTNTSERDYIVRKGETEGEILIETDSGLMINRKARTNKADYKSIKLNNQNVNSPEAFLKTIFTELQLNPIEFLHMNKNEQNRILLDMIEFSWDINWINEQFGEIPPDVDYQQNILEVLNQIQQEKGYYFQTRQDVNRDIRNKKAIIEDIAADLPENYNADKWTNVDLGTLYRKVEAARNKNSLIDKAHTLQENRDNRIRGFEATKQIDLNSLDKEISFERNRLEKEIEKAKNYMKNCEEKISNLEGRKKDKVDVIESTYIAAISKYDAEVGEYTQYLDTEKIDVETLSNQAEYVENMKAHLNEYGRMKSLQEEVETLTSKSENLTFKIEKARTLPGEILKTATIPIAGLTVENGIPLINGLPVSNLSEGKKLDLCIDVTVQNPKGLQITLIDGIERLSTNNRENLYKKCKAKGLQFIATRTTDDKSLNVIEL